MKPYDLTTDRKALTLNLDIQVYGTFAEIGAGQEVARHFFTVGGAAATIAKSMSAYDMKFSDDIYGKCKRYVSKERLLQMLDHEYQLLVERLNEVRGKDTTFFVYANTVAARNYQGTNECHGWMGIRFQLTPLSPPNDIMIHVRMLDKTAVGQQEALGIIGVNLIYGAFIYNHDYKVFIESLADNLGNQRIEVDMISFKGPAFEHLDNRILSLQLVHQGLTNAVMFNPDGVVMQPSEVLYKKAILLERGSFRPITHINIDMLNCAGAQLMQEPQVLGESVVVLLEITINNLFSAGFDLDDFIARVDIISALGYTVLISNYQEYYRLSAYFRRYTQKMIGLAVGINHLLAIFDERYYEDLEGGILEACGRLFKDNVKLYVYPMHVNAFKHYLDLGHPRPPDGGGKKDIKVLVDEDSHTKDILITADNLQLKPSIRHLYLYLKENNYIEAMHGVDTSRLNIFSRDVLKLIQEGKSGWEEAIPEKVAEIIKERNLFISKNNENQEVF